MTINYNAIAESGITVKFMDITGRVVQTNVFNAALGINNFTLDVNTISNGIYIVELTGPDQKIVRRLMIDK